MDVNHLLNYPAEEEVCYTPTEDNIINDITRQNNDSMIEIDDDDENNHEGVGVAVDVGRRSVDGSYFRWGWTGVVVVWVRSWVVRFGRYLDLAGDGGLWKQRWKVWRPNIVEVPDCEINGPRKVSKDVCSVAEMEGYYEFVVRMLDKTLASSFRGREIGNEKLIGVLDLQKITYKNIDAHGFITGFQFLQAYYPERLAKCYILNMPLFFVSVWRLISRFLEKATLEKIVIVTNEEEKKDLMRKIGEEVLPEEYGGRAKLIALQDVKVPHLIDVFR
ncbi:hypothetical protein Dsin_009220 [Dipteronia sinensis]|uniref:CRAL-TRIO domain-containing protein n=1 Tax=Dipteronia sinensis TaxID=43782 RepID=A0AAE0AR72_9ROSI|nr:hypothetical protein Dsin_009220 [Dipteronia sinensis]